MNLSLEKVKFNNATLSAILDEQKFKIYCLNSSNVSLSRVIKSSITAPKL